ncbi:MAG: exonuclease SbcD [Glaciecola sp.]|jgi:exonuclease SbcD
MRLLHTSDWHVGRTIRGRTRVDEHRAVLAEICDVAQRESVDAVLVAGDLFDTGAPTAESEKVVWRALRALSETVEHVVLVAGNHDNWRRLQAIEPLIDGSNIHTGAELSRPDQGGVLELTCAGQPLRVALLPFLSQRGIVRAHDLMAKEGDQHGQSYSGRVKLIVDALTAGFTPESVNVVLAHLTVASGQPVMGGGERAAHTIFDYVVSPGTFPATASYVALGHLHKAHKIPGAAPLWYCGAPLALDFGEVDEPRGVLLVDVEPYLPAKIQKVELTTGRRLRTLKGTVAQIRDQLAETPGLATDSWVRVVVQEPGRAGLGEEVRSFLPDAVDVAVERPEDAEQADAEVEQWGLQEFHRSPVELVADYLATEGIEDERLTTLFHQLLEDAHAPEQA